MEHIRELINRRRRQCIVARIFYYCYNENLIPDSEYDKRESELKVLCKDYPKLAQEVDLWEHCPSHTVGSCNLGDYPWRCVNVADRLYRSERK
jgi:NAD-dependent DNA ligase